MSESTDGAQSVGGRMTLLGAVAIVLGMFAMLAPGFTGLSIALLLGFLVLGAGAVRIFWAFRVEGPARKLLMLAVGGLTLLCGVALVANPLLAAGVLTAFLALYFLLDGILEVVAGIRSRPLPGWGWLIFGGAVSVLLAAMIWSQFPLSGPWAMGILLGIKLFLVGLIMVTGGGELRAATQETRPREK